MVRAQSLGYEAGRGAAQHGRLTPAAPHSEDAEEPRRERVPAAGRVDDVGDEGGYGLGPVSAGDERPVGAARGGDAADAPPEQGLAPGLEVRGARQAHHLLLV